MFQHGLDLLTSHAREPLEKLINPRPALEILEKRFHGYARTFEQPDAAHLARHALNSGTFAPIEHARKIRPRTDAGKLLLWSPGSSFCRPPEAKCRALPWSATAYRKPVA